MSSNTSHSKGDLLKALKNAGLPYTMPNFVMKYERTICDIENCANKGEPFLACPRDKNGYRTYSPDDIRDIVKSAKLGWFMVPRHFHWKP